MPRRAPISVALLIAVALLLGATAPRVTAAPPAQGGGPRTPTPTTPPSGAQTRATIDAALTQHWTKINNWMNNYAAGRGGRFFQGLRSHSVVPAGGQAAAPDRLSSRPTDQAETLGELWNGAQLPGLVPFALTINVYDGPDGRGWEAVIEMVDNGQLWQRVVNSGPETWREQPWALVSPE
jgi:hypothetical protein